MKLRKGKNGYSLSDKKATGWTWFSLLFALAVLALFTAMAVDVFGGFR